MADIRIENMVASTTIADELELTALSTALPESEYEPEQFPGLVLRLREPKTAALLFESGKMVCTGARKREQVEMAIRYIAGELQKRGLL
ncbi:MAG: hypothetical protein R6U10_06725 [Thermoplasmatota archaeon]